MDWLRDLAEAIYGLLENGGPVIAAIGLLSILMWTLIIERYWFLLFIHPGRMQRVIQDWNSRADHDSWYARRIREGLISEISSALKHYLLPIQALIAILPLLGLLGTVTGMISTFEVMTVFGTGNARGLASGISIALLTTTAGLVTSLSGLYFSANLKQKAELETHKAADQLS